ncbi:MAG: adaptor protein MecA [Acutalibacteraceae bacterium]
MYSISSQQAQPRQKELNPTKEDNAINITTSPTGSVIVELSSVDLEEFSITYEELDYNSIDTRRVIWTILDKVNKTLDTPFSIDNRILIETAPTKNGGCIIIFSHTNKKDNNRVVMKKECEPVLFKPMDINALLDALDFIKNCPAVDEFSLHKYLQDYYIIITPQIASADKILFHLSDYGKEIEDKYILHLIEEHGL